MTWLLILMMQSGARAADICADVADAMRSGKADGPVEFGTGSNVVIPVLASHQKSVVLLGGPSTNDVSGVLRKSHATPALLAAAEAQFGPDFRSETTIAWLGKSGAGAIEAEEGKLNCTFLLFFDTSSGEAHEVAPPAGLSFDEGAVCGNAAAWVGAVGSMPALIEEDDNDNAADASLTIVPWQDHKWAPTCRIEASFKTVLSAIGSFCSNGVDCNGLKTEALSLAQRLEAGVSGTETYMLPGTLTSDMTTLDHLPTFNDTPLAPYTTFTSKKLYALPANGSEDFAVVGPGSWGWRDFSGYLVAVWHQDGNSLQPVAGFQLLRQREKVASVKIMPP